MREVVRLFDLEVPAKRDETGDDDDDDDDNLDDTEDVKETETPLELRAMKHECKRETGPADQARPPVPGSRVGDIARTEEVIAEDDRVSRGPSEEDTVGGVERSD